MTLRTSGHGPVAIRRIDAPPLVLEPLTVDHAHEMFEVLADAAIYEFENAPPASEDALARRYAILEGRRSKDGKEAWLNWAIRLADGRLAGYVQATVLPSRAAYVAYELGSRWWRRGIGSAAVTAMIDELAREYRVTLCVAVLKARNFRSLALLRKLGFVEGSDGQRAVFAPDADELLMVRPLHAPPSLPDAVTFEPVSAGDFESLAAIRIDAMRESLERIGRFDPARARERLRAGFVPAHARHILAGGARVGFVIVTPRDGLLSLDHLYIVPGRQGAGTGGIVLQRVLDEARSLGLRVRVGALRESDSNRFYVRHGFRLVERAEFDNFYEWSADERC